MSYTEDIVFHIGGPTDLLDIYQESNSIFEGEFLVKGNEIFSSIYPLICSKKLKGGHGPMDLLVYRTKPLW